MKSLLFLFLVLCVCCAVVINGENWCRIERQYCRGRQHIACHPNQIRKNCQDLRIVPLTGNLRSIVIGAHNYYRNFIASGKLGRFPSANSMREMSWDNDLGRVAEFHAKRCQMQHDQCRSTSKFHSPGQNLAYIGTSQRNSSPAKILRQLIKMWFDEYRMASPSIINRLSPNNLSKIGHFTVMVRENNYKLGCAYAVYRSRGFYGHLLTCNYSDNNWINTRIYSTGRPATNCRKYRLRRSSRYGNLCA